MDITPVNLEDVFEVLDAQEMLVGVAYMCDSSGKPDFQDEIKEMRTYKHLCLVDNGKEIVKTWLDKNELIKLGYTV